MRASWLWLLFLVLPAPVFAQDRTCSTSPSVESSVCADQGAAYSAANAVASALEQAANDGAVGWCKGVEPNLAGRSYTAYVTPCDSPGPQYRARFRSWDGDNTCSSRSPLGPGVVGGVGGFDGMSSCSNGCKFAVASGAAVTVVLGGKTWGLTDGMSATGETCVAGEVGGSTPVEKDDCVQSGNLTQCVKPDGRHCATASTGKQFCWSSGEAGVKKADNNNQAATKSPANTSINAPKDPPANGGDWTVTGQGTVSETKGGTTTTSTITTFDSSYGKTGTGKGDGTGTGGGSGDGDGDGDDDGEDDEAGGVGEAPGDFYKPTELTVSSLMGEYYTKVSNTPVLGAIKSFMVVNGGGSCPVFSMPATQWTPALSFDAHCSGTVYSVLQTMGWVLLAIVAFFAVRIAVT